MSSEEAKTAATAGPTKPIVYGWGAIEPYHDSSPSALKLETYLKICGVEFETVYFEQHQMKGCASNKKVPWIHWNEVNGGQPMGDTTLILNELMKHNPDKYNLDQHLSKEEYAIGVAIKTMLEESTYFTGVIQSRWVDEKQFSTVTVPTYFDDMFSTFPMSLLKGVVTNQIRKKIIRDAQGHGTANTLSDKQVQEKFLMELQAVSDYLGTTKKYIMGDQVTSFDATVFAYMAILIQGKWNHPCNEAVRSCDNIQKYVNRMQNEFWS